MRVEIRLEGPMACGKTHTAEALAKLLREVTRPGTHVVIKSTNVPKPDGIDNRPTGVWEKEHDFHV